MTAQANPQKKEWVGLIGDQDFFEKNEKLKRPLSKHLTIYEPQLTAILSTFHRGTGAALAVFFSASGIALGFGSSFDLINTLEVVNFVKVRHCCLAFAPHHAQGLDLPVPLVYSAKYILAWPLAYHFLNGVRHLVCRVSLYCDCPHCHVRAGTLCSATT
jgi:succinate dehydrogenase (ubiquinone) cytochrome b560 subunit